MKKILIVINTSFVNYGGLTTVVMNYYKKINKKKFRIDIASTNLICEDNKNLIKYLNKNNSNYYCLGNRKKNLFKYLFNLFKLINKNNYDVIHVNGNSSTMIFELFIAKLCKVKVRISHGHTSKSKYVLSHLFFKKFMKYFYTDAIAVSKKSGDWLYETDYLVLNNAIDINKYKFNNDKRVYIRQKYNWNNKFVIGNVGKLYEPKNQEFLIKLFEKFLQKNNNSLLVLVGGGPLENKLKQLCRELKIEEYVYFMEMQKNVEEIIQGFDLFIFPSKYEGLGLALIEAQTAGLKCIASTEVPIETKVTENIEYVDLNSDYSIWIKIIENMQNTKYLRNDKNILNQIQKSGFDISKEVLKLEKIYDK